MFSEYEKQFPEGSFFKPTKEQQDSWRSYAREELGVESNYLYDMIINRFRFQSSKGNS